MAEVVLEEVTKVFNGGKGETVTAVNAVDLTVKDKEFLVLVGPSGCGKSTLLRMIAGLEEISRGRIHIDGRVCNGLAPRDRKIAMVFQNYSLYPHMSVAENLGFALKLMKTPKERIRQRVHTAAEVLGLGGLLDRRPGELSGGQRQRVALGRAIVRKPSVFLFDEPLSNLDAKMRVQMRVEISRLVAELRITTVYVTHDQTEAMTMGERIVCMRDGTIQQVGRPMDLYANPANRFVAGFIGTPPMNFLDCFYDGRTALLNDDIELPLSPEIVGPRMGGGVGWTTLGIRPENIRLVGESEPGLDCSVDLVEPLGAETLVYCRVGGNMVTARFGSACPIRRHERVRIGFEPGSVYLFDRAE